MINLGRHSYCYGVQRGQENNVHVGAFSSIAEGVIFDGGFVHPPEFVSSFPFKNIWTGLDVIGNPRCRGDIYIGNDVTIGEDCIIMSGITIEDGAMIGARSIITKNVPPYAVMTGMPAQILKYRHNPFSIVPKLMKIKWWEWNDEKVKENAYLLNSGNINEFINKHYHE